MSEAVETPARKKRGPTTRRRVTITFTAEEWDRLRPLFDRSGICEGCGRKHDAEQLLKAALIGAAAPA